MKIIVTGGAGFIGSNFIYYALAHHPSDEILCYDALTYAGNLETLQEAEKNPRFRFLRGDIADRAAVFALFEREKPDVIVNFAAESHVDRSIEQASLKRGAAWSPGGSAIFCGRRSLMNTRKNIKNGERKIFPLCRRRGSFW